MYVALVVDTFYVFGGEKMKRMTTGFLALAMLLSLAACGGKTIHTKSGTNRNASSNHSDPSMSSQEKATKDDKNTQNPMSFTPMLVVDNEDCAI